MAALSSSSPDSVFNNFAFSIALTYFSIFYDWTINTTWYPLYTSVALIGCPLVLALR